MSKKSKEKRIPKAAGDIDITKMLLSVAKIAEATGQFMIKIGEAGIETEKRDEVSRVRAYKFPDVSGEAMGEYFIEQISEDKLGPVLKIIHKLGGPPDISTIITETPDKLIAKGKEYVDLATKLKKLLEGE